LLPFGHTTHEPFRLHLAEARCESPISDRSEQRSAHSAVSRRTTELEAVLPTVKSGWRQSRLRLSRAAFRAVTRVRALRLHLTEPGVESYRPRSLWTDAPRCQPLGDRRIWNHRGSHHNDAACGWSVMSRQLIPISRNGAPRCGVFRRCNVSSH
jgi:hypothetical protein